MPRAGELNDRFRFERRAVDDNGDRLGPYEPTCTLWAQTTFKNGGEKVLEDRLQGSQTVIITVRACAASLAIDNSFQAVDERDGTRVFKVAEAHPSIDRAWVEILAVRKVGQTQG